MIATRHEYRGYVFTIEYQSGDPIYSVSFADFAEIITSGATLAEAFVNACESLDLHLESLQKLEQPVPEPRHMLVIESA